MYFIWKGHKGSTIHTYRCCIPSNISLKVEEAQHITVIFLLTQIPKYNPNTLWIRSS